MNMSKKGRLSPALLRVRKRNSISIPSSLVTHNAVERRASLLKNNKNLAITLQETRCELSAYKSFFDESLEFLNKAKLARSRMAQLSSAFKNFLAALDENLTLLDFDESKWLNIKPSSQPGKVLRKEMYPINEVAGEVPEEVSVDQEMNCEDGSRSDQVLEKEKAVSDILTVTKSPQKVLELSLNKKSVFRTRDAAAGNENARAGVSTFVIEVPRKISALNSLQTPLPPASTQAAKVTKIPIAAKMPNPALAANLKSRNFAKESSNKSQNKTCKRKLPEKVGEESDPNFSRRKTFVVKKNVLTVTETIPPCVKESVPLSEGDSNVSLDRLISKNDKRQTFVIPRRNALEESEPATSLNNIINKDLVTENRVDADETGHVQEDTLKNKRKTFVKKPPLHQNDGLECPIPFPNEPCTSVNSEHVSAVTENHENSNQSENLKSSANVHREHSEIDHAAVKNTSNSAENSKNMEHTANFPSLKTSEGSGTSSKLAIILSRINTTDEIKGISENLKSKIASVIPPHIATEDIAHVKGRRDTFTSYSEVDEDTDNVGETNPINRGSFMDSSESDCEVMMIEELVDFSEVRPPALQTTPIRRQITKIKKKKFTFDGKQKGAVAEETSQSEIVSSETGENDAQKSAEVCQSGIGAVSSNENDVNRISEADDVQIIPEVVVNSDDLDTIPSDAFAVRKKTTKRPRKIKDNQIGEKESQCEIVSSETSENDAQKSAEVCQSGIGAVSSNENDVNRISEADDVQIIPKVAVNRDYLDTIPSDAFAIMEKITKRPRKMKDNQIAEERSQCEIVSSETSENDAQKRAEVCQSGVGAVSSNENEVNRINEADDVQMIPKVVVNRDDLDTIPSDAFAVMKKTTKRPRKIKDNQITSTKKNAVKKASKVQNSTKKKNPAADIEVDALVSLPKKVRKKNVNNRKRVCFDDNEISKFEEIKKNNKVNKVKGSEKVMESDFPIEKIGTNTFRVQAEIHPPPSSLKMRGGIGGLNKENEKLDLRHMQVSVVLEDILKSNNIGLLNVNDTCLLYGEAGSFKSLSTNASNFAIDPEESIEKLRCDPAHSLEDCDLDTDDVLDMGSDDLPSDAATDNREIIPRRRGKEVNYKEKPLNRKMRRN